jgi:hypothetical protein
MTFFEDLENDPPSTETPGIKEKIASFAPVRARPTINIAEVDAAAAPHGFISREPGQPRRKRKLAVSNEPTRHLAMRCRASVYERFLVYADKERLHYHDALERLLDIAEGSSK